MDMREVKDDFLVCVCKKHTKKEIIDFIRENDIKDLITLRNMMNTGNKCGGCGEDLEQLLEIAYE